MFIDEGLRGSATLTLIVRPEKFYAQALSLKTVGKEDSSQNRSWRGHS